MVKKEAGPDKMGWVKIYLGSKYLPSGMKLSHAIFMHVFQKFSKKCQAYGHPDLHTYRQLWDSSSSEVQNTGKNQKR